MLKDRVKKWDQEKNIKPREMDNIIRRLAIRESAHKHSEIRVRGRVVSATKVMRYRKRNSHKFGIEVARIRSPTPPDVKVYTRLASPLSKSDPSNLPEWVFKSFRDYISVAFEAKIWLSVGDMEEIQLQRNVPTMFDFGIPTFGVMIPSTDLKAKDAEDLPIDTQGASEEILKYQDDKLVNYVYWLIVRFASQRNSI